MTYTFTEDLWLILKAFKDKGYKYRAFSNGKEIADNGLSLYLRHDVDFDCQIALSLAREEAKRGIKAGYYFLLRSEGYNLLSEANKSAVEEISALGHEISLHFDPTLYANVGEGLLLEKEIFEAAFNVRIDLVSIHRPQRSWIGETDSSLPVRHLYEKRFIEEIQYCSDSGGSFRFGHPLTFDAFHNQRSFHLLLHPIWWLESDSTEKLNNLTKLIKIKNSRFIEFLKSNCKPFKTYIETGHSDNATRT